MFWLQSCKMKGHEGTWTDYTQINFYSNSTRMPQLQNKYVKCTPQARYYCTAMHNGGMRFAKIGRNLILIWTLCAFLVCERSRIEVLSGNKHFCLIVYIPFKANVNQYCRLTFHFLLFHSK